MEIQSTRRVYTGNHYVTLIQKEAPSSFGHSLPRALRVPALPGCVHDRLSHGAAAPRPHSRPITPRRSVVSVGSRPHSEAFAISLLFAPACW